MTLNNSLYASDKTDWETPNDLFNILNREFSFTIDVCATEHNTKCEKFYSPKDNSLAQKWIGVAWMNPPYGRGIDRWARKAYESSIEGCVCVCLLPVRSDTRWWHKYVMRSSEIRLLSRRLSFKGSNNKAPFPASVVVFRPNENNPKLVGMQV